MLWSYRAEYYYSGYRYAVSILFAVLPSTNATATILRKNLRCRRRKVFHGKELIFDIELQETE